MIDRIEIIPEGDGTYTVRCGQLWDHGLAAGEALDVAAGFIFQPEKPPRYLVSDECHAARERRRKKETEPATLEWKWVSAGRWEADSINTPGYVYAILLDGQRFYFIRHAYGDASIDYTFASWLPTMREAQEWCERQDDSLMPF